MKRSLTSTLFFLLIVNANAQVEPTAATWKTWFINSVQPYRLPAPPNSKDEIREVLAAQQHIDSSMLQQINYWSAGSPGYRWETMISAMWTFDTSYNGALANMLLATGIYDATIAAWDSKYTFNRPRPFNDTRIKIYSVKPGSPSYPCEHSVAAGVASTIIAYFYPAMADSVNKLAKQVMASRIAAGVAYPSDTRAGFELGKKIAEKEIEFAKDFTPKIAWDRKMPDKAGIWKGPKPMFPMAGLSKTVILDSSSQLRPPAPPDFAKEMEELKKFKPNFRSNANAFFWASQDFWFDQLHRKIFEYNLQSNPPRAARLYAATAVATYDAFIACFDAKYAYWGIRPDQYDTTYRSLVPTPPFPGYPSGHAVMSGLFSEMYSYFFPAEKAFFQRKAKEAAESRFQAGIHFRTDNEVGLDLGRKVAALVIQRVKKMEAGKN